MDQRTRLTTAGDGAVARLREVIEAARTVVPFTGAGISTECGIPDFRSPGGIWTRYRPIQFEDFLASREMRDESWRRRFAMEEQFSTARPGRGHLALAGLYRAGKVPAVIPQNIDNPHHAAGHPDAARARGSPARRGGGAPGTPPLGGPPGSPPPLRARLGARAVHRRRRIARLRGLRRLHQDGDDFLWPTNARGPDAPRRGVHAV